MAASKNELAQFEAALYLSREKGVGAAGFKRLLERHKQPTKALEVWRQDKHTLFITAEQSLNKSDTANQIEYSLNKLKNGEALGLWYSQNEYPKQLYSLSEPPPVLFLTSKLKPCRFAAVVGARKATKEAVCYTQKLVLRLAAEGYAIISGGAAGVDSAAHSAALKNNIYTAAVLATGIDVVYPPCNTELFKEIAEKGVLMSEMMFQTKPQKSFFPARNRIVAAMADVICVVQASHRSGAMITARWGVKLNRKIITVNPLTSDLSLWGGNLSLIKAGAKVY